MPGRAVLVVIIVVLSAVLLGIGALYLVDGERAEPAPILIHTAVPTEPPAPTSTPAPIQVYVNGAVVVPDVYVLSPDSRVKQAVEAAGGFTEDANTVVINLAEHLVDGMYIYVPEMAANGDGPQQAITQPGSGARAGTIDFSSSRLVNINTAGLAELDSLPGVGPAIAQKIIDYRTANGSFATIEAILDVSGIGEAKFEQLRNLITTGN